MQRFRSYVRSWRNHDELSFRRPFCSGSLQFSNPCCPAGGDPRAASPTCGFAKERAASLAPPLLQPVVVGCAVPILVRLAAMSADGSARHGPPLAPQSFHLALDAEVAPPSRKARSGSEPSRPNSAHAPSQPLVGRTQDSRRTTQVGDCGGTIHGGQVFASAHKPPSQTWRAFLTNHLAQTASIDFFTVPTATFRVLFLFVVLSHERRRVVHFGVTEHPTQEWTLQQMREAFPWDQAPRYVLRDRDAIYGRDFAAMTRDMGMEEVLTAPRSPWQNPYVERLIASIRRECLDHVIVWNQRSLRRILQSYLVYYQHSRTHIALAKDAPESRAVEKAERGRIVVIPQVGGLHHRYQRQAA